MQCFSQHTPTLSPTIVYEFIAKRILAAARKGERDAERLRDIGLARRTG
jgi:hypothetical protein